MAIKLRDEIKAYFAAGKRPTQQQFWDWLDSFFHQLDEVPMANVGGLSDALESLRAEATASYQGAADASTNPGTPAAPVWYFATAAGTYTNFIDNASAPIVVSSGDLNANLVILTVAAGVAKKTVIHIGADLSNYYDKTTADSKYATLIGIAGLNALYSAVVQEGSGTTILAPYAANYYTEPDFQRNIGAVCIIHKAPLSVAINGIRVNLWADAATTGEIRVYRTMTAPTASATGVNPTTYTLVKTYAINNNYTGNSSSEFDLMFDAGITLAANEYLYICAQSFNGTQVHAMQTSNTQSSWTNLPFYLYITSPGSSFSTSWTTGNNTTVRSRPIKYITTGTTYAAKPSSFFPTKSEFDSLNSSILPIFALINAITQAGSTYEISLPYDNSYYYGGQPSVARNLGALALVHDVPANVTIRGIRVEVQADAATTGEIRVYKTTTAPTASQNNVNPNSFTLIKTFSVNNNYTGAPGTEFDLIFDADVSLLSTEYLYIFCQSFNSTLFHTTQIPNSAGVFANVYPYLYILSPGASFGTSWSTGSATVSRSQPVKYIINYLPIQAKPNNYFVTKSEFAGYSNTDTLTFANSDKIAITGCSYTAGHGTSIQGKAWINLLQNWTNYILINFAVSGSRMIDVTNRIRNNTPPLFTSRSFGIKDVKPRFTIINNIGNETVNYQGVDTDGYIQEVQEATDAVKSVGSFPVFTSEWMIRNPSLVAAMQRFADENGSWYHDFGSLGDMLMTIGVPAVRWGGTHPDTRGQLVTWSEVKYLLDRLPKAKKSIKLYRKRSDFTAGTINALNFDGVWQRVTKWKEILTGNDSLATGNENYIDRVNSLANYSQVGVATRMTDEYIELLSGNPVTFDTYALIELTLDKIRNATIDIYIKTAQNASFIFYLKNNLDSSTYEFAGVSTVPFFNIIVSKAVYDSVTINPGDTYTTPHVTDGTNPIQLVAKGKMYSPTTGYLIGFATVGNVNPAVKTTGGANTMTRTSGTGSATIAYTQGSDNLSNYPFELFNNMGKPMGSMANVASLVTYANGYYKISLAAVDIAKYVKYDNIKLVLNLPATSFTISDVYVNYSGGAEKQEQKTWFTPKKAAREMLPSNLFTTWGTWTTTGNASLVAMSTTHQDYPTFASITKHAVLPLDAANNYTPATMYIGIPVTAKYGHRKVYVRAICRVWPKLYRPDLSADSEVTTTQQITKDSYDFGTLCCAIAVGTDNPNGVYAVMRHPVGIGWMEAYFEFDLAPFQSSFSLKFYRDIRDVIDTVNYKNHTYDLNICAVSCMVEGE